MSCHYSVLAPGVVPHPPHRHAEEEVLIVLDGEAVAITQCGATDTDLERVRLEAGQFMYYPAGHLHTIENDGSTPVLYVMFKWTSNTRADRLRRFWRALARSEPSLQHIRGDSGHMKDEESAYLFAVTVLFVGASRWLRRLHCHVTHLQARGWLSCAQGSS